MPSASETTTEAQVIPLHGDFIADSWAKLEDLHRKLRNDIVLELFRPTFTVLDADGRIVASGNCTIEPRGRFE